MSRLIRGAYKKCGTVTISVYQKSDNECMIFDVKTDNDKVLPVSYVIEDTLKSY